MQSALKEVSFEDAKLHVGMKMQLLLQRGSQKIVCYSNLIGYETGEYVLLKVPQEKGILVTIQAGDAVHIRVFSGLAVFAFVCYVENVLSMPRNCMYLSFPSTVQSIPLRRALRTKVDLPAIVTNSLQPGDMSVTKGQLRDLSVNGALFSSSSNLGKTGERISLEFPVALQSVDQDVVVKTEAVIRNIRQAANSNAEGSYDTDYGLEFVELSQNDQQLLQHFTYESMLYQRQ